MNFARVLLAIGLITAHPLLAVYAPIPEQELGKDVVVSLSAGVSHDSNIFGAQSNILSSMIYEVSPKITFNASLTDQTFGSASYKLVVDNFENRPGKKTIDSHDLNLRLAHSFSSATILDLSNQFQINKNPESLMPGVSGSDPTTFNTDQSVKRNGFDGKFTTTVTEKAGVVLKLRSTIFRFYNPTLAKNIDRSENLFGFAGTYALLPETKLIAEYRREEIGYRTSGPTKDKRSDFAIGGFDYKVAKKLTASARLGYTWRHREAQRSATAPYAELSAKIDFAERSFITTGYSHGFEETSNVKDFNDTEVNKLFLNIQAEVTQTFVVSGSVSYEPSQLQARSSAAANVDETATRIGLAITWFAGKNWAVSASFDHDKVKSSDPSRSQLRDRTGANATYTF